MDEKTDLEKVIELAVQGGQVTVSPYTRVSTAGKEYSVSPATRGAPGPKTGVTNPGGSIRSNLSTARQANEAGAEVASAIGSANKVTVGSSTLGRTPLTPYTAAPKSAPAVSSSALAAGARAATAGAAVESKAIAAQTAIQKAQLAAKTAASNAAAAASKAQTSTSTTSTNSSGTTSSSSTPSSYTPTTYTPTTYTPSTYTPSSYTPSSSSSGSSGSSSSSGSKATDALRAGMIGSRLARLGHGGGGLRAGSGGRAVGALFGKAFSGNKAKDDVKESPGDKKAEEHRAVEDAAKLRHDHLTGGHHTPVGFHSIISGRDAAGDVEKAADKSVDDATKLTMSPREIIDLQMSMKAKGYPVKITGTLSHEFVVLARAYLKAAK